MARSSNISNLNRALHVSTAGIQAQNKRLLVISQNIANIGSRASEPGGAAYQRKLISFKNVIDSKTGMEIIRPGPVTHDTAPSKMVYSPTDPGANTQGFVAESNVRPMIELTDMREANLTHKANLRAYEKALSMIHETINLLK